MTTEPTEVLKMRRTVIEIKTRTPFDIAKVFSAIRDVIPDARFVLKSDVES